MPIKRIKLQYQSAVKRIPPVAVAHVSAKELEKLDQCIISKIKQNANMRAASLIGML